MKKSKLLVGVKNYNLKKYTFSRPAKITELEVSELDDLVDDRWSDKARQLQVRKWRRIRHQLA